MTWRHAVLILIPIAVLIGLFSQPPIPQPLEYHQFADFIAYFGIPNFKNVISNGAFFITGLVGLYYLRRHSTFTAKPAWWVFFAGVVVTTFGSGYYHWAPGNDTLVWDRLSISVAFTALAVAVFSDHVDKKFERPVLFLFVPIGMASVLYWHFVTDDLRFYFALQGTVFLFLFVLVLVFINNRRERLFLTLALGSYVLAFISEWTDQGLFDLTRGQISGHTMKHLFAGLAPFWLVSMLTAHRQSL